MTDNTKPEVFLKIELKAEDKDSNMITTIICGKDFYDNYWLKFYDNDKAMEIRVLISATDFLKLGLGDIDLFTALEEAPLLEKVDLISGERESRHITIDDLAKEVNLPKRMHFGKKLNSKKLMF